MLYQHLSSQAFGHPIACGGNTIGGTAINQCWIYKYQSWLPELDMSVPRSNAAATVINDGRHDLIYWVTFGEDDTGNELSSSEYLPWYGESWKSGPSLGAEYARQGHCLYKSMTVRQLFWVVLPMTPPLGMISLFSTSTTPSGNLGLA